MFGELSTGHCERGAPNKRFKGSLKKSLSTCNIYHKQWSDLAADRGTWRHTIYQASAQFEEDRREASKDKRQRRNARAASTDHHSGHHLFLQTLPADLPFPHRSGQPRACLQPTTTCSNIPELRSRSQAMMMMILSVFSDLLYQLHAFIFL